MLMLFFSCFWSYFNLIFNTNSLFLLSLVPLFNYYSFSLPFTNLLILVFSSFPLNACFVYHKISYLYYTVECLGQTIFCSTFFILIQLKEFVYSYYSFSDCLIGSIFYFTLGLHGLHVIIGCLCFFIMFWICFTFTYRYCANFIYFDFAYLDFFKYYPFNLIFLLPIEFPLQYFAINLFMFFENISFTFYSLFSIPFLFTEFNLSLLLSSMYWHFVDFIWFFVFLIFYAFTE
jgi:heme/copper-type cytochrome/quinol oxidase subunit 3